MTPLGIKLRALRAERRMTLSQLAERLDVSPAYLSALEHGHRGAAGSALLSPLCQALGLTWDEAHLLQHVAQLSHPRVTVDTAGLSPAKTELANRLAQSIGQMTPEMVTAMLLLLDPDGMRSSSSYGGDGGQRAGDARQQRPAMLRPET